MTIITIRISGLVKIFEELSESDKDVDIIRKEDKIILLEHGQKVITTIIIKKNLQNARFFLKELTKKFEQFFLDYYDRWPNYSENFFQSVIQNVVKDLIHV